MPSFGAYLLCLASLQERKTLTGMPSFQFSEVAPVSELKTALQFKASALFDKVKTWSQLCTAVLLFPNLKKKSSFLTSD